MSHSKSVLRRHYLLRIDRVDTVIVNRVGDNELSEELKNINQANSNKNYHKQS